MSDTSTAKWVAIVGAIVGAGTLAWSIYKDSRQLVAPASVQTEPKPAPVAPEPRVAELNASGKADARVQLPHGAWEVRVDATATSSASPGGWMRLSVSLGGQECNFSRVYRNPQDPSDELQAHVECLVMVDSSAGNREVLATAPNEGADAKTVRLRVRLAESR